MIGGKTMMVDLPRGNTCRGCGWLEREDEYRGWCTLPPDVPCLEDNSELDPKGEDEEVGV